MRSLRLFSLFSLILLALTLMAGHAWARQVYKWVDETGKIHYGDAPNGAKVETLNVRSEPPSGSSNLGSESKDTLKTVSEELLKKKEERLKKKETAADDRKKQDAIDTECKNLRDHLKNLQEGLRIIDRDENGNQVFKSDADREQDIVKTQANIKERCK